MRYHVPFAHRHRCCRPGPIYIGFDEPVSIQKRRGRFNWFGFTGLMLVLISPLTAFVIAPIALLFCLIGLMRAPRGMAIVGMVFSLVATTILSLGIYGIASHQMARHQARKHALVMHQQRGQIAETRQTMDAAVEELRQYRADHDFYLPNALDGNVVTVRFLDAWETELRYEPEADSCTVRSAGPDREFDTSDDLTVKLDGKTVADPYIDN